MSPRHVWARLIIAAALVAGCSSGSAPSPTQALAAPPSAASSPTPRSSVAATATMSPTPEATPSSALPVPVDIEVAGALKIPATPSIDWTVVLDGQAWIAGPGDGIGIFDASGKMQESVKVGGACESMDVGFDAVWSASCLPSGLFRIDAASKAVKLVTFDDPINDSEASVGAGEGAVWVVVGARSETLLGVDPTTLEVTHRYPIPDGSAGVRAGLGGVWITRPGANELLHVDPSTGEIVATIPVGPEPRFLAVGEGSVWVMNQLDGTVSRVDPATDTVTATIDTGPRIYGGDISVGGGSVWVRGGPGMLSRIDPARDLTIERYGPEVGSGSAAADKDAVWITAHDVSTIWRLPLD